MSILNAALSIEDFNPKKDKVALMLKSFTINGKDGGLGRKKRQYSEPYFVGLTIAANSFGNQEINFGTEPYPNTKRKDKREFLGTGMRIYGPENPGDFLLFQLLVMESDSDIREAGNNIRTIMNGPEVKSGILPLLAVNPSIAIAAEVLKHLSGIISKQMMKNKDDELMRTSGTLMRDVMGDQDLPFKVGKILTDRNDAVDLELEVLGISNRSRHRKQTESVGK